MSDRRLRILIATSFPDGPNVVWYLGKGLSTLGHKVEFLVPAHGQISDAAAQQGIPCHIINIRSSLVTDSFLGKRFIDTLALYWLHTLLLKGQYDVLHLNLLRARVLGRLASLLVQRTRVVSTIHGPDLEKPLYWSMERSTNWRDVCTVAVSRDVKSYLVEKGISPNKLHVINNGLDLQAVDQIPTSRQGLRYALEVADSDILIGMVAYMYPGVKGHETFLQAARRVLSERSDVRFVLIGGALYRQDRWYEQMLRKQAANLGLGKHVLFLGNRQDVVKILDSLDLVVLPSNVREGFGMSLLEAMARGKPVVGSRIGGIPDIIEDGKTGILINPRDPDDLARAILAYASDPELRRKHGGAGRRRVESYFTSDIMVANYIRLFTEVASASNIRNIDCGSCSKR